MVRSNVISDELWTVIEPVLPTAQSRPGRPWNDHRLTPECICWRFRTGSPWRDLPAVFGAWQSVWERRRRWFADGSYERMFAAVKESTGVYDIELESLLSVDSTSDRAHQHAVGAPKLKADTSQTGGQGRVTSFCSMSLLITPLGAPAVG
jgi:putative transposase